MPTPGLKHIRRSAASSWKEWAPTCGLMVVQPIAPFQYLQRAQMRWVRVTMMLSAMFWDLKGAAEYPSCLKILHSAAVRKLFPTLDIVPCSIIALATQTPPECCEQRFVFIMIPDGDPIERLIQSGIIFTAADQNFLIKHFLFEAWCSANQNKIHI